MKRNPPRRCDPQILSGGFSLLELVAVVAIAATFAAVSLPSLNNLNQGNSVTIAGNQLVDIANQARQNAMTQNSMTALVIVTASNDPALDYKAYCLMECKPGSNTWTPATKWQSLPSGVKFDRGAKSASFLDNTPMMPPTLENVSHNGRAISSGAYGYQVFLPNGSMASGGNPAIAAPPTLNIVSERGNAGNYYQIIFNQFTGTPKALRP